MQKRELTEIFRKHKSDNEIFHDLMPLKVREILLVATIYDAFTLEQDGFFSEIIFGEYHQLNLTNAPRITSVSSKDEAIEKLNNRSYDLVFILSRLNRMDLFNLSKQIKEINPNMPIFLLLNDNAEIGSIDQNQKLKQHFDQVFVWNGHSEIFLAMVKFHEDKINVFNDSRIGLVRVILLVEDSIRYYSRYLPILYSEIVKQTQCLITDENQDEMKKILRMRGRPKVLLASTYEEAMSLFEAFREYLLCVISDVAFPMLGNVDPFAGIKLTKNLKAINPDLPILLQSSDCESKHIAHVLGASFINKNSDSLSAELTNFFYNNLGFGDFIFRNSNEQEIARSNNMKDLQEKLNRVPAESILYHASHNHFSAWLMARGEIQVAQLVHKAKIEDFKNAEELRLFLLNIGESIQRVKTKGKIIPFESSRLEDDQNIVRLGEGSLGGKGRGIAFLNSVLCNSGLSESIPEVNIKIPRTAVIGNDEFAKFMAMNKLAGLVSGVTDYDLIKRRFLMSPLSPELQEKLKEFLEHVQYPLAVRSSGQLEDSVSHPLSGLYQTFFLPNNHQDPIIRFNQLTEAIKLVYASIYSKSTLAYFEAIDYKVEEERMAVVLQQVVGTTRGSRFYPHVSGIAQSFNFYPFSYIEPQDGSAIIALGLGRYVVGGEQAHRFCPVYPHLEIDPPEQQLKSSQGHFYALDLTKNTVDLFNGEDATLKTYDIREAEEDGVLQFCASVWNFGDNRLEMGLHRKGPRILNFPHFLKFNKFPLAEVLRLVLNISKDSMETPVEIEFAINLDPRKNGKPTFYLLQVKHLLRDFEECSIDLANTSNRDLFLFAEKGMGNGVVNSISDIVWVDPQKFEKSKTLEMGYEIEKFNLALKQERKKYFLVGPGRWGTRDPWLGIPISWPQISHAKIIVEYSLENFHIDASLGSHFFHNVTSMNIGYFSVGCDPQKSFIDWEWLKTQEVKERMNYTVHSRLEKPAKVVMDAKQGVSVIFK